MLDFGQSDMGAPNPAIAMAGVPDPATWAMLLLGVGLIGLGLRHRLRVTT